MRSGPRVAAFAALLRKFVLPMNPFWRFAFEQPLLANVPRLVVARHANANGFGFIAARKPRFVEFVQLFAPLPLYEPVFPAADAGWPLKNARNVGSVSRARLPTPMEPKPIRLFGATAPLRPSTDPGTTSGKAAAVLARFRNWRRL